MVRTTLRTPMSKVACHSSSSSPSNGPTPTSTGPAALTRASSPVLPPLGEPVECRIDLDQAREVSDQGNALGAPG